MCCFLCIEWEKQKLTSEEAFRAIGEIIHTSKDQTQIDHIKELSERIISREVPVVESNEEADTNFWNATHPEDE